MKAGHLVVGEVFHILKRGRWCIYTTGNSFVVQRLDPRSVIAAPLGSPTSWYSLPRSAEVKKFDYGRSIE